MNDSRIKDGLDEAIGKEQWLTDDLVQKITKSPRKRPKQNWKRTMQPILAMLAIIMIGGVLYFLPNEPEQSLTSVTVNIKNDLLTEQQLMAVNHYFTSIEERDLALYEEVSRTEVVASPKEVFEKYKVVDFSTLEIMKTVPLETEIKLYLRYFNKVEQETYIHTVYVAKDSMTVSEDIYADWQIFEPYVAPQSIALIYSEAAIARENEQYRFADYMLAQESVILENGVTVQWAVINGDVKLIIERDRQYFDVGSIDVYDKKKENVYFSYLHQLPSGDEMILVGSHGEKMLRVIYYSEELQAYQYVAGLQGEYSGLTFYVKDELGAELFCLEGKPSQLVTVIDDHLMQTTVEQQVQGPAWLDDFLSITFLGGNFRLTYNEDYWQQSHYYQLKSLDEAVKD